MRTRSVAQAKRYPLRITISITFAALLLTFDFVVQLTEVLNPFRKEEKFTRMECAVFEATRRRPPRFLS